MFGGGPPPPLSKRVFMKYDKDNSGKISYKEFKDLCYELGYHLNEQELALACRKLDVDGSNNISYDEFQKWWKTDDRFTKLQLTEEEQQTLTSAINYFKYFDKDGSGTIDRNEFKGCHADLLRHKLTLKTFEDALTDLDTDGNGVISFNEYVDWLIRIGSVKVKVMI